MKKKTVFKHKYSKTYFFTVMNTIHKINHNISARLLFFKKIAFLSAKLQFTAKLMVWRGQMLCYLRDIMLSIIISHISMQSDVMLIFMQLHA